MNGTRVMTNLGLLLRASKLKFAWYSGNNKWAVYRVGIKPVCYGPFPAQSIADAQARAIEFLLGYIRANRKGKRK